MVFMFWNFGLVCFFKGYKFERKFRKLFDGSIWFKGRLNFKFFSCLENFRGVICKSCYLKARCFIGEVFFIGFFSEYIGGFIFMKFFINYRVLILFFFYIDGVFILFNILVFLWVVSLIFV